MNPNLKAAGCLRTQAASQAKAISVANATQQHVAVQPGTKRFPPFGRVVSPDCGEIRIYCGSKSWDKIAHCRANNCRLILPPGNAASLYVWLVRNREVLIWQVGDASDEELSALVREVLRQGSSVARVFEASGHLSVHHAEVINAAA